MLVDFWQKYRSLHPNHQLWRYIDSGHKDASKCIPLYLHGDEGTSFKKGGIFIFSFQGAVGFGTSKRNVDDQELRALGEGIRLNFLQTGLQTRILICCCPKDCIRGGCCVRGVYGFIYIRWSYTNNCLHTWWKKMSLYQISCVCNASCIHYSYKVACLVCLSPKSTKGKNTRGSLYTLSRRCIQRTNGSGMPSFTW